MKPHSETQNAKQYSFHTKCILNIAMRLYLFIFFRKSFPVLVLMTSIKCKKIKKIKEFLQAYGYGNEIANVSDCSLFASDYVDPPICPNHIP